MTELGLRNKDPMKAEQMSKFDEGPTKTPELPHEYGSNEQSAQGNTTVGAADRKAEEAEVSTEKPPR